MEAKHFTSPAAARGALFFGGKPILLRVENEVFGRWPATLYFSVWGFFRVSPKRGFSGGGPWRFIAPGVEPCSLFCGSKTRFLAGACGKLRAVLFLMVGNPYFRARTF